MVGRRLGHFEILSLLGQGGMGAVYKARDTHLDRLVAVKLLPHEKMADAERKRRFSQEAKAASALNHPNIITIYDIASDEDVDYIAMEYVEGQTMEALLASGPLAIPKAVKYARQMADGLAAAHAAGILHRDLKPANVMVREDGIIKLLDFGLAKLAGAGDLGDSDATRTLELTRVGTVMGTVAYMSPEQAEGKKLDFRSDVFSYGVVLYEMVAGKRAFAGDSQASVIASLLRDEPQPVGELRPGIPFELDRLITRCLRKDPERRVQTMADVKAALEDLPDVTRTSISGSVQIPPPPPPAPPRRAPVSDARVSPPPVKRKKQRRALKTLGILLAVFWLIPAAVRQIRAVFTPAAQVEVVETPDPTLAASPLITDSGSARQPSLSPDGMQVAYSWNGPDRENFDIYVKSIDGGDPVRLTSNAGEDFAPSWSPDGHTIAFLRRRGNTDAILLIAPEGGAERQTGEIPHRTGNVLAWSDNSHALVFPDAPFAGAPVALYELTLSNGARRRVVKPRYGSEDLWPAVSPNGSNIAFVRRSADGTSEIFTAEMPDSDESDARADRITDGAMPVAHPVWTSDGEQLIFTGRSGADSGLWRVPAKRKSMPRRLLGAGEGGDEPAIAGRGSRMVYSRKEASGVALWLVNEFH